ncbi:polyketide synthase [Aspergillus pseudoustus]|uniref:Polyketide synthase n=1 Tax=Aspergillus pseudoustus TaxID=1810923 RepID=A0ABR4KYC9_9EURO
MKCLRPNRAAGVLRRDVSYVLVGGLGGIGREIALWMAERGAQHIILVNRSGLTNESSRYIVEELKGQGVHVYVRAIDIADSGQMAKVTTELAAAAPPII